MKPALISMSVLLFGAFGLISAFQKGGDWWMVILAIIFGLVGVALLQGLLQLFNAIAKTSPTLVPEALQQGLAFMLPFALLALLADGLLGWQSAQTFFAAGLAAVATTTGTALLKQGATKWGGLFVPVLWASAGSLLWLILCGSL